MVSFLNAWVVCGLHKTYSIYWQLGKWYAVKHNCVTWGVFNDYIMDNYMFRPVLAILQVVLGELKILL